MQRGGLGRRRKVYRTRCPVCRTPVEAASLSADKCFPFCSPRCKMIDLGRWFDGEYCVSEPLETEPEEETE